MLFRSAGMYGPEPAHNAQPHTLPHPQSTTDLKPSYATVVSTGQQPRCPARQNYPASAPDQSLQHPVRTRPQPSAFNNGPAPSNPIQYPREQGPSYAQVAASLAEQPRPRYPMHAGNPMLSPAQMMHPKQAYNSFYNAPLSNQVPSAQP